jgi:glycyl-tRNA synthetase beta chain
LQAQLLEGGKPTEMPDFLLEIGCEEIPARMIEEAVVGLWQGVRTLLEQLRLSYPVADLGDYGKRFYTPRRLSVLFPDVSERQSDSTESIVGPSVKVAFKDGEPTPAALAFAKKVGVDVSQLRTASTAKGDYLAVDVVRSGRPAIELLAEMIPSEIFGITWPKSMYWYQKNDRFVRPIRWLVALLDDELVPVQAFGVRAQKISRGHRQLGTDITVGTASSYPERLKQGKVIAEHTIREKMIRDDVERVLSTLPGARWREDKNLLDTVVNLTEWPSAILGAFDHEFLQLPEEVLVTVMRDHQKYFAVEDGAGKLMPHFLAVLNTDGDPEGVIRHGHERVLRARFNDARFFWQTDQKHPLRERVQWLKQVTFQKDLGSYYEKTLRVQRLCSWLCEIIRQSGMTIRPGVVHKAAYLAKTDLTTELVKEFTELQGIVGGLYARVQELDSEIPDPTRQLIAQAIYDQYKPESMEDSVPQTPGGAVLSIADKADTIAGMFALGLQPTGSKDPFALRRQANGIVRTIAEHKLPLSLDGLFRDARETYRGSEAERKFSKEIDYASAVREFLRERVEFYLCQRTPASDAT